MCDADDIDRVLPLATTQTFLYEILFALHLAFSLLLMLN